MRDVILLVGNRKQDNKLLNQLLSDKYIIITLNTAEEAIPCINLNKENIAAILIEFSSLRENMQKLLSWLYSEELYDQIPILGLCNKEPKQEVFDFCFTNGIYDFIVKPYTENVLKRRLENICEVFNNKAQLQQTVDDQIVQLQQTSQSIIDALCNVIEARNLESGQHIFRVREYTKIIANDIMEFYPEYRLTQDFVDRLAFVSALHDIGKVMVPDMILLKPGKLTPEEFEIMKTHTTLGADLIDTIINALGDDYKQLARDVVKYHHEKYDGCGYPDGLVGDEIPIAAQIVSLADVFDALTQARCYKKAYLLQEAFDMIMGNECGVFSYKLRACLTRCFEKMCEIFNNYTK